MLFFFNSYSQSSSDDISVDALELEKAIKENDIIRVKHYLVEHRGRFQVRWIILLCIMTTVFVFFAISTLTETCDRRLLFASAETASWPNTWKWSRRTRKYSTSFEWNREVRNRCLFFCHFLLKFLILMSISTRFFKYPPIEIVK